MIETWKSIVGYEGIYSVSDHGQVRRDCGPMVGRILKPWPSGQWEYPAVSLCREGGRRVRYVHDLVLTNFVGPRPPGGYEGNHIDGNHWNNALTNLEWVTSSQNKFHAWGTGLMPPNRNRGELNGRAKLTPARVEAARNQFTGKYGEIASLAARYGVHRSTMRDVLNGTAWCAVSA